MVGIICFSHKITSNVTTCTLKKNCLSFTTFQMRPLYVIFKHCVKVDLWQLALIIRYIPTCKSVRFDIKYLPTFI